MKIMTDTNIFISAALFPKGRAAKCLYKAMILPYQPEALGEYVSANRRKMPILYLDYILL